MKRARICIGLIFSLSLLMLFVLPLRAHALGITPEEIKAVEKIVDEATPEVKNTIEHWHIAIPDKKFKKELENIKPELPEIVIVILLVGSAVVVARSTKSSRNVTSCPNTLHSKKTCDRVICSVFGRPTVKRGETLLIQVFAHKSSKARETEVRELAVETDNRATRRATVALLAEIERGETLHFELNIDDLPFTDNVRSMTWTGASNTVQYGVKIPKDCELETLAGRLSIFVKTILVGKIVFTVDIINNRTFSGRKFLGTAEATKRVFVSYSRKDSAEVLKRIQGLRLFGIDVFQDNLSLLPGDVWEQTIYKEIDDTDYMLLCWSEAANQSDWVSREWHCGLERKGSEYIQPLPIEKPIPAPPDELKHLHFDDWMLAIIDNEENHLNVS